MGAPLVVLAAGGTGGHLFPATALALALKARGLDVALLTDRRSAAFAAGLDGIPTHVVRGAGIAGKGLLGRALGAVEIALGILQCRALLRRLKPTVVVGFGGYPSVAPLIAAGRLGIRTVLHEQNAVLGRANRLLAPRVTAIATSFAATGGLRPEDAAKATETGNPVRPAIAAAHGRARPPFAPDGPFSLLVLGGSQGARVFSDVVPAAVALLPEGPRRRLRVAQQCRPEDLERARAAYAACGVAAELATFFADVPERLAGAHLLVCRAGAGTVAEIGAVGCPAILVPFPHAIDDHQTANARAADEKGGAWLMPESAFTPKALAARLEAFLALPATLEKAAACARATARTDAAERLADLVVALVSAPTGGGATAKGGERRGPFREAA
ncbi:MAG: undecaprenyldiphospho-muramoylpentapeptide beta-N-acetylglucosaminyltransferase [Proteobacteria bacterium]|nr:undecaprenyldiphospho-muramoylpentapeptide beta-N-acetylglucosaminyltransferase [Pseudomonadota bacterium]